MHFGAYYHQDPIGVERKFLEWLKQIENDATHLILVGDIFDYWFEYKYVVPRGYTRVIGKLADMADHGVKIHLFTGNHDIWISDYLPKEIGCQIYREPTTLNLLGKEFYIAHGDEFIQNDPGFKLIQWIFRNKVCQKLYASIHPWFTVGFAHRWALASRKKGMNKYGANEYRGEQNEYLVQYAKEYLKKHPTNAPDFFIFGHRHIMLDLMISKKSRVVILGDWIRHFSFGVWDGENFTLETLQS